jgi:hypothetical protein
MSRAVVLVALVLAACGADDLVLLDPPDAAETSCPEVLICNPVSQSGCASGEKCTHINNDTPDPCPRPSFGCVPDGTVLERGACAFGPAGPTTGYDDCVAGQVCVAGICEPICTVSPNSCASGQRCTAYEEIFPSDPQLFGACGLSCDPVTQTRTVDGVADCGASPGTRGCYGLFDDEFSCAAVPTIVVTSPSSYEQGSAAASGGAFVNGCAPGFAPLLHASNDVSTPIICVAYCDPLPTSLESPAGAAGASPHSCPDRGAATEECRYFWARENASTPTNPDGVGFCWTPENYGSARCNTISATDAGYATSACAPFAATLK